MTTFDEATAVRRVEPGSFVTELDAGFALPGGAVHGGYLLATLLRAVTETWPSTPHPVATSANFLRATKPGPAQIRTEPVKRGRTATVTRVTLVQDDAAAVDSVITTGTLDADADPAWCGEPPPMPRLEECVSFDDRKMDGPRKGFGAQVDMRFDRDTMGWLDGRPAGRPEMRAYFRLRDPHEPDPGVLALAIDALPPVVFGVGALGWAPTVELTWYMRGVPEPGWLRLYGNARLVSGGWFDEGVEVWDSAGRLVAQGRQLARVGRGN